MKHRTTSESGSTLLVALLTLVLAGAAAAILGEIGRLALVRARIDRDGLRAWFVAERGLADTLATVLPGSTFTDQLALEPEPVVLDPPWSYLANFLDDIDQDPEDPTVDANGRVWLRIVATGPTPIQRRLDALIGRADPWFPGAVTLAGGVRELTEDFRLDGRDFARESGCAMTGMGNARAGLALPEEASLPEIVNPEQITGRDDPPSIARGPAPDLSTLAEDPDAARYPGGTLPPELGNPTTPQFTIVEGDAIVDGTTIGAGLLYCIGRLQITGALAFTGVVAAARGVELSATGDLAICGGLWAAGETALDARGRGSVRASADAIRWAAELAPLPAPARIIAARERF